MELPRDGPRLSRPAIPAPRMPEPVKREQRYIPGLDGLRAIAVLAVIAYHLHFKWAPGGLLGVGVFFTLSGYLITDLLLAQLADGRITSRSSGSLARADCSRRCS